MSDETQSSTEKEHLFGTTTNSKCM